jgi:hypothetical protein
MSGEVECVPAGVDEVFPGEFDTLGAFRSGLIAFRGEYFRERILVVGAFLHLAKLYTKRCNRESKNGRSAAIRRLR